MTEREKGARRMENHIWKNTKNRTYLKLGRVTRRQFHPASAQKKLINRSDKNTPPKKKEENTRRENRKKKKKKRTEGDNSKSLSQKNPTSSINGVDQAKDRRRGGKKD